MAIRRTLKQKKTAETHRVIPTYSLPTPTVSTKPNQLSLAQAQPTEAKKVDIFGYPVSLIYRDLMRTVIVSLGILALIGVISIKMR